MLYSINNIHNLLPIKKELDNEGSDSILRKKIILIIFFLAALFIPSSNCLAKKSTIKYKTKYITTKKYLGKYKITYYCPCPKCCGIGGGKLTASGTKPKAGRTIGVDPKIIPYGSRIKVGNKTYIAEDTGGGIQKNHIDIFVNTHDEALRKGVKYKKVYLIRKKKVRVKCKG